jgi:hypothetical protein
MTEEKRCNRCGSCCMVLPWFTQHMHPEFKKYLLTRGLKEDKEQGCFLIPHVCQHLKMTTEECIQKYSSKTGERLPEEVPFTSITGWSCDIHNDPERPEICRKFHGQKLMKNARIYIPPNCVFAKEK